MKSKLLLLFTLLNFPFVFFSQSFTEGFEDFNSLNDWFVQNNSDGPNLTWGAGNANTFTAESGSTGSYLSANYNSSNSSTSPTLSNWLFTPTRTFNNGDIISFYTRTAAAFPVYPDRMEVRMSTAGNSIFVGSTSTSVGSFSNLLLTINPTLSTTGYPTTWSQYTITISGLNGPTNGRIAFRYFVTNGGPNGANSNYIGLDSYTYTSIYAPPANDDCVGAISLNQTAACNLVTGSVAYATESMPACTGNANDDVWYKFTATTTGAAFTVNGSYEFDPVVQLFSGNCAVLNSMNCIDNSSSGESEMTSINTLTVGQTYYLRIHDFNNDVPNTMTFTMCVQEFNQCNLTQPNGSQSEGETCGIDINGGCNSATPVYSTITCDQTYFGTAWAANDNKDTDWYKFNLQVPGLVTFSGQAEFPYTLMLVDISDCNTPIILASASYNSCNAGFVNYNFSSTGEYAAVIVPTAYNGTPCNTFNDYFVTLNLPQTQPIISTNDNLPFCINDSITLHCATPNGNYQWLRNGSPIVGANQADLTVNQAGSYTMQFTNLNGCTLSAASPISATTQALDNASFSYGSSTVCQGSANVVPTNAVNGYYTTSGNLVFADTLTGEINVGQSSNGTFTITHHTQGACPNTSELAFTITALPSASFNYPSYVVCNSVQALSTTLSPGASYGNFSADNGINLNAQTGDIYPQLSSTGVHHIVNTIAASGVCPQVSDTVEVFIGGNEVTFPNYPIVCSYSSPFELSANVSGGAFSGNGVIGNVFDPSLVSGTSTITHTITDTNNCTNVDTLEVTVDIVPTLSFGNYAAVCQNASAINLNNGQPTGGVYVGTGISNNQFNPALAAIGNNSSSYIYTTTNGCSDTVTGVLIVKAIPQVVFDPIGPFCDTQTVVALTSVSPAGGQFSGDGINGSTFNAVQAGLGTHTLTYTVTANGCTASQSQNVDVQICEGIDENAWNVQLYPNPAKGQVNVFVSKEIQLVIYALDGKILANVNLHQGANEVLDVSKFASGTYLFAFSDEKTSHVQRLIIE